MASRLDMLGILPAPVTKRTSQSLACANGRKVTDVCSFARIPCLGGGTRPRESHAAAHRGRVRLRVRLCDFVTGEFVVT